MSEERPIVAAIREGDVERVRSLLDKDPSLIDHEAYPDNYWPLHVAVERGQTEVVRLLLAKGVDVDVLDWEDITPLLLGAMLRPRAPDDLIALLLASGADPSHEGLGTGTPLHWAALNGDMQLAAMLLAHGADIEATDHVGRTPLCEAAESDQTEMVQLLRSHGAKVTLPIAVRIGDLDAARELLQQGADPNEEGPFSKTALQIAIERRAPEFSDLLLAHGADLTLHEAAWMGDHERVRAILAAGVAVDAWDRFGKTALHWAAEHGHAEACRALLEAGADARAPRSSWEARMARVREQGAEAVKFLKKHGPGIGLRDQDRSTPVDLAKANHHTDVVHLLRAHLRATRPWWAFWRT